MTTATLAYIMYHYQSFSLPRPLGQSLTRHLLRSRRFASVHRAPSIFGIVSSLVPNALDRGAYLSETIPIELWNKPRSNILAQKRYERRSQSESKLCTHDWVDHATLPISLLQRLQVSPPSSMKILDLCLLSEVIIPPSPLTR
jgi:hypothetical protein